MARVGTTVFIGSALALLGYAALNMGATQEKGAEPKPSNTSDEVTVTVKAAFYEHPVFGQGKGGAPFIITEIGLVKETDFPQSKEYRRVYSRVKRGTTITVTVSPGDKATINSKHGCSILVDNVLRSGPAVTDKGQPIIGPEFQQGSHAAVCTAVAS